MLDADELMQKLYPERYVYFQLARRNWTIIEQVAVEYRNCKGNERRKTTKKLKQHLQSSLIELYDDKDTQYLLNIAGNIMRKLALKPHSHDLASIWSEDCCKNVFKRIVN
jgi:hypothetical protein